MQQCFCEERIKIEVIVCCSAISHKPIPMRDQPENNQCFGMRRELGAAAFRNSCR